MCNLVKFNFKKVLGLFVVLAFSLFVIHLFQGDNLALAETGTCGKGTTWELDEQGILTISGKGKIVSNFTFGKSKFVSYQNIRKVVIEYGITEIDDYAFRDCSLIYIEIPDSVTRIGTYAFHGCKYLNKVVIPNSVETIGSRAFDSCFALKTAVLSRNIDKIRDYTFFVAIG